MIVDDIEAHMSAAGAIERAAMIPGMFFAWCVNLQLVSNAFAAEFERELLRLRYRDLSPAAFFLKTTGGRLETRHLSDRGTLFAQHYYGPYRDAHASLYQAKDDWDTYDLIAADLKKAYYAFADGGHKVAHSGRHWWQVWR